MMTNMYNNQFQGMNYNAQKAPSFTQPLSAEEINKMKRGANGAFNMNITEAEKLAAICTHKDTTKNNQFSLNENGDGSSTCYICGKTFKLVGFTKEEVAQYMAVTCDILQTIKTFYLDMPPAIAQEFMIMLALIERIPQLYDIAINNFQKYDSIGAHHGQYPNSVNMLAGMMNPGAFMMGQGMGMPNPMMGGMGMPNQMGQGMGMPNQMGQGMMDQNQMMAAMQSMMQNMMGGNGGGNPFGYQPNNVQQPAQETTATDVSAGLGGATSTKMFTK